MNALGTKGKDHLDWLMANNSYVAQEKLDGMRAVVHVTKTGLRIFGRSAGVNDPAVPLEKTSALPHLAGLRFPGMDGVVLDAEILARGMDSAQLSGNIHRNDVADENRNVKIFVFDVLRYGPRDMTNQTLRSRISFLDQLKPHLQSPSVEFLPWAFGTTAKQKLYQDVLSRGGEGIMLKNLDEIYYEGGRPANNWYKAKKSISIDAVVMG
ncbi:MAG TPA: RNA ligase family protein, partial [Terriglobia bacterium]|nr:RNA ligase family protein [Terriglobia bacterium]